MGFSNNFLPSSSGSPLSEIHPAYRIVLACNGIPTNEGPSGAASMLEEFAHRPWHTDVKSEWTGSQLILRADNDYDSKGQH